MSIENIGEGVGMRLCPTCHGEKEMFAYISHAYKPHTSGYIACYTCQGVGEITDAHAMRIERGKQLRLARNARNETLIDCATRLGLRPSELSAIENGRRDP